MTDTLKARADQLAAKLKQARAALQAAQQRERHKNAKAARALDTRRKVLMGAFVLDQIEQLQQLPGDFMAGGVKFGDWLSRDADREVFGLTAKAEAKGANDGQQ